MKPLSYNPLAIHETTFRNAKWYLPIILIINTYISTNCFKGFFFKKKCQKNFNFELKKEEGKIQKSSFRFGLIPRTTKTFF